MKFRELHDFAVFSGKCGPGPRPGPGPPPNTDRNSDPGGGGFEFSPRNFHRGISTATPLSCRNLKWHVPWRLGILQGEEPCKTLETYGVGNSTLAVPGTRRPGLTTFDAKPSTRNFRRDSKPPPEPTKFTIRNPPGWPGCPR